MFAWTLTDLFSKPIPIDGSARLLMLIPLALTIALVYKTIRCRDLKDVPVAAGVLCVTIVLGMMAVGVALWVVYRLLA